jgi:hypothetical protein
MTRVILLGASNLANSFPTIVARLSAGLPGPISIFAALGHGRSYCTWSRILFRALPGINGCDLWEDLNRELGDSDGPTLALLTDVGNDLIYGSAAEVIAARVEQCVTALAAHRAEIVLTRLPLASVERLSALRFHATKAIFFPRTKTRWPGMIASARALDGHLADIAGRFGARFVEQPLDWFGFDPIHIRRGKRGQAWDTVMSGWSSFVAGGSMSRLAPRDHIRLRLAPPAERRLFGRHQRRPQPALTLGDVTIRLY